ncbi:hypothetical protein PAXRUDRAFT_17247 [Paxillus rubicundulus Ve08.2h10]|uniref:Unplaced genomic scaffold scaffold_2000, whole genome shotgun sequence n=1 Tax=Paxillus rubicundulus Ve08.2h10 TaxID=930991 RepID=A0A0D0CR16_9AGAM|nr:hypothetical protein PAXRUDRAFT_17247 [Paxillus rubicundulus Ve08.2h10]
MPVPSPPKRLQKIHRAHSNQQSLGEGTSIDPHATEPQFLPISQLVVPAQPKPRKNKDFKATQHHAHPGELVIPAAPKTAVNQAIRPPPQHTSTQIDIPSGPRKAHRISTTHQSLSTHFLPSEPKDSCLNSVQSMPGPSNPILAPDVFNEPEDIAMDYMDVGPSPSQINPLAPEPDFQPGSSKKHSPEVLALQSPSGRVMYQCLLESQICMPGVTPSMTSMHVPLCAFKASANILQMFWRFKVQLDLHARPDVHDIGQEWPHLQTDLCVDLVTENRFADTLAAQISYKATPDPRKIDYKEGLDDLLKRARKDYQQMFAAACKHRGCVLKRQKRLVVHMEQKKYII